MSKSLRSPTGLLSMFALLAGAGVYLLARPGTVFGLSDVAAYSQWTASLPSLLHTFGFALLLAGCARSRRQSAGLALAWGGIETAAELLQTLDTPAVAGLTLHWTFDTGDLAAIVAGTVLALVLILTRPDTFKR